MPPPLFPSRFGRAAKGRFGSGGEVSGADAAAAAAGGCIQALPEDLVAEVLARVSPPDVAFLLRCALVCKRWRRLLADPAFLRRIFPDAGRTSLLGFLVQRRRPSPTAWRTRIAGLFKNRAPAFVPAPGSALGPRRRFLTSFVCNDAGLLQKAEPMAEREGLVILRVFPRAARRQKFSLCVCNLLTGKLDALPLLDVSCFDGEGVRGYAVLSSANHGAAPHRPAAGYSNLFQVHLIGVYRGGNQLSVRSFSTAATVLQNWRITDSAKCDAGWSLSGPYGGFSVATICGDKAHWLFQMDGPTGPTMFTVDVCLNTGYICSNKIILSVPEYWPRTWLSLSVLNGRLLVLYQHDRVVVPTPWGWDELWLPTVPVAKKSGTLLLFFCSNPSCAYLVDRHSRSPVRLAGWKGSFKNETAVPYEVNWLELFMSRLGVQP